MATKSNLMMWIGTDRSWSVASFAPGKSYDLLTRGIGRRNLFDHVNAQPVACQMAGVRPGRLDFWVDDEGLLKGLRVNPAAVMLDGRRLVGPIVITGGCDSEGETLGLSEKTVQNLIQMLGLVPAQDRGRWPEDGETQPETMVMVGRLDDFIRYQV